MSPTRDVWKPLRAKTRAAASRMRRRFSSAAFARSTKAARRVVLGPRPMQGPLVVDLSRYLPGAFATRELQRLLGARVVRVESPEGDPMRLTAAEWHDDLNAGKESIVADLPADAPFVQALLARADVVVESFRPGVAARLGIGPEHAGPSTVYCSVTAFGVGAAHEQPAGHHLNYHGWAGVLEHTAPA